MAVKEDEKMTPLLISFTESDERERHCCLRCESELELPSYDLEIPAKCPVCRAIPPCHLCGEQVIDIIAHLLGDFHVAPCPSYSPLKRNFNRALRYRPFETREEFFLFLLLPILPVVHIIMWLVIWPVGLAVMVVQNNWNYQHTITPWAQILGPIIVTPFTVSKWFYPVDSIEWMFDNRPKKHIWLEICTTIPILAAALNTIGDWTRTERRPNDFKWQRRVVIVVKAIMALTIFIPSYLIFAVREFVPRMGTKCQYAMQIIFVTSPGVYFFYKQYS